MQHSKLEDRGQIHTRTPSQSHKRLKNADLTQHFALPASLYLNDSHRARESPTTSAELQHRRSPIPNFLLSSLFLHTAYTELFWPACSLQPLFSGPLSARLAALQARLYPRTSVFTLSSFSHTSFSITDSPLRSPSSPLPLRWPHNALWTSPPSGPRPRASLSLFACAPAFHSPKKTGRSGDYTHSHTLATGRSGDYTH